MQKNNYNLLLRHYEPEKYKRQQKEYFKKRLAELDA